MARKERIFLSPPHLCGKERDYVAEVFASNYIAPAGPMLGRLENAVSAAVGPGFSACALSSATASIDLVCDGLGIGEGDIVVCPSLTFIASIAPAVRRGAKPFFADSDPASWTLSPDALEEALSLLERQGQRAKAVVAVDLYGQCCDYGRIERICAAHGAILVEDAAEALGAACRDGAGVWRPAGSFGAASVFSFNGNKIATASGGGMLVSRDAALVEKARFLSQQAKEPRPYYFHERLGYNYRMSNVSAAIGLGQFETLDFKVRRRREIFEQYRRALPELAFLPEPPWSRGSRWLTVALLDDARQVEQAIAALEAENIEARRVWNPMHLQPVFAEAAHGPCDVAETLFTRGICLPSGDGMDDSDVAFVAETLRRVLFGGAS